MKHNNWIDLHMHSSKSADGEVSPKKLMELCAHSGLKVVALADHNSTKGIVEAKKIADQYEITCISAVELDCTFEGINLHVLGYAIEEDAPIYQELEQSIIMQEKNCSKERIRLVEELGIQLDHEKLYALASDGIITGELIGEVALMNTKNHTFLEPYLTGERKDNPLVNFYWDYCAQGKKAYVPIKYPTLEEVCKIIHNTGGIAVLAHPGNNVTSEGQLNKIFSNPIQGIEVYSSYHTREQMEFYLNWAKANEKLVTMGSDFHGKIKPSIKLGQMCIPNQEELWCAIRETLE